MPGEPPGAAELESLLAERGERLLRTAIFLAGGQEAGEDLLQAALERVFRNRSRIHSDVEGYLRRTMVHLASDRWRRHGTWRGKLGLVRATAPGYLADATVHIDQRDQLVRLLLQLPSRQRAAIVLRSWEDLSEAETAEVMGCSVGTVKSAVSRGMQRLRELSGIGSASQEAGTGRQP
jgi:RNA polymerase sigma-70 factor (sigma-E family)